MTHKISPSHTMCPSVWITDFACYNFMPRAKWRTFISYHRSIWFYVSLQHFISIFSTCVCVCVCWLPTKFHFYIFFSAASRSSSLCPAVCRCRLFFASSLLFYFQLIAACYCLVYICSVFFFVSFFLLLLLMLRSNNNIILNVSSLDTNSPIPTWERKILKFTVYDLRNCFFFSWCTNHYF